MYLGTVIPRVGQNGGPKKVLSCPKGKTKKFFVLKRGVKKLCQIDSIMKVKMHNLFLKSTGYSLRLHLPYCL